jgi:hypothetical protein
MSQMEQIHADLFHAQTAKISRISVICVPSRNNDYRTLMTQMEQIHADLFHAQTA